MKNTQTLYLTETAPYTAGTPPSPTKPNRVIPRVHRVICLHHRGHLSTIRIILLNMIMQMRSPRVGIYEYIYIEQVIKEVS
jgi:hypothetical protein